MASSTSSGAAKDMTSLFDFIHLGEVEFSGPSVSFFGDVYVYYNTVDEWSMKEFQGVLTNHGDRYRGRWTQGPQFEELKRLFLADKTLRAAAIDAIHKRLNIYEEKKDG
jgi:hypothetical protein